MMRESRAGVIGAAVMLLLVLGCRPSSARSASGGTAAGGSAGATTAPAEQVLEFTLNRTREIPADLAPRLFPGSESDAISALHQMVMRNDDPSYPEVTSGVLLRKKEKNVFSAPAPRGKYYVLIAHPGFLYAHVAGPFDAQNGRRRFRVDLPTPGGIRATLIQPSEAKPEHQDTICVTAFLSASPMGKFGFDYVIYKHPLRDWKLERLGLTPGKYTLHGTIRGCDYDGGPAEYVGAAEITVHPGRVAEFRLDMSRSRNEYYKAEEAREVPQKIR